MDDVDISPRGAARGAAVEVYVVAEVLKPEDRDAIATRSPVLVVLNKADLTGFAGSPGCDGPLGAARARAAQLSASARLPVEPMIGLLAAAALEDLDDACWAALRALAAHPQGASCLDGSFAGFLTADLPLVTELRLRLLESLDLFGIALVVAALRRGASRVAARAMLRRVSGVDEVVARLESAGAEARYRRVVEAVAELEALAVTQPGSAREPASEIDAFLRRDETVLARMAAAVDAIRAAGLDPGPDENLARAVRWQRYSRESVNELHRACGTDITRGSLRLWSRSSETGRAGRAGRPGEAGEAGEAR